MSKTKVLVTGGSGFVGGWCVRALLERGFHVNATVRPNRPTEGLAATLELTAAEAAGLTVFHADMAEDHGWREAVEGCRYILHVASPTALSFPDDPARQLDVASNGSRRVLRTALAAGVERVVMTSTTFTMAYPKGGADRRDRSEADWTDPDAPNVPAYVRAKTLAERGAWELAEESGAKASLTTIAPGAIVGPLITRDVPSSLAFIQSLLNGQSVGLPRLFFGFVDPRDLADLNILAMESPAAAGERFIASGPGLWFVDLARLLQETQGEAGARISTQEIPSETIREAAPHSVNARLIVNDLDVERVYSSAKAERLLGWTQRPLRDSLLECVASLRQLGLVADPAGAGGGD